jgi:glutamate carboxypeptidase
VDRPISQRAAELAPRALAELEQLVAISTPSGDVAGAEAAFELCHSGLPSASACERPPCSTAGCAPDLIARISGSGSRRLLLLGHVDTVVSHAEHRPLQRKGERLFGSGAADMKGGVAILLALARELAATPAAFAELGVLLVCDEEWRVAPFSHVKRFTGYDACLCFEAGERARSGEDGLIVRRKGAATLRVRATGRAAHSGSAPQDGRNALLALANAATAISGTADPDGPDRLTVVPTIIRAGDAINVVPASGELVFDLRADHTAAFLRPLESVPAQIGGATLHGALERVWPAMDSEQAVAEVLLRSSELLGSSVVGRARGGASDASHFASTIPWTLDGLGPRGGGAHTPEEFIHAASIAERIAISLAVARTVLAT